MNELEAINFIIDRLGPTTQGPGVVLGPGDDAAIVEFDSNEEVAITSDVLLSGRHFHEKSPGDLAGYRCVAVNVSDLSSMGATPRFLTVSLTIEATDQQWLGSFADGIRRGCLEHGARVIGGNLTKGPKSVAITALGTVARGSALKRSGAELGDEIWLTGILGASTVAIRVMTNPSEDNIDRLMGLRDIHPVARYFLPVSRNQFAVQLRGLANSCTDISDGLAAELGELSHRSGLGMRVDVDKVPLWRGADTIETFKADDSYELVFTANPFEREGILELAEETNTPLTKVGVVTDSGDVEFLRNGKNINVGQGYSHF